MFIQSQLEAAGHGLAGSASRPTLLRRATFDLLGLPPTPAQQRRFLSDTAAGAWERLIDRLLASPHYGERWGRHWLDAAGYADSEGVTNTDPQRKWAWKYRDWVIAAHKSQGTMQLAMNKGDRERYFVLDTGTLDAHVKAAAWFEALKEPQSSKKVYSASAGTNASSN